MQILVNVNALSPSGGVEVQLFEVARELAARGHVIDVCYLRGGELEEEYREFCRSLTRVPGFGASGRNAADRVARLVPAVRAARRHAPDVVYLQTSFALGFGVAAARLTGARLVCHLHGRREPGRVGRVLVGHVDRFVAVSRFVRDGWVEWGIDPGRIAVVPNGIDPAVFTPTTAGQRLAARRALDLPPEAYVGVFLGRLDPDKGLDLLLDAWGRLGSTADQARLVIQGSPSMADDPAARREELRSKAPPGCHWLPMARDVTTSLRAADVVVVPTLVDESFGRVVVEALACGIPVVAARVGGIPEILDGDLAGLLFPRGDVGALAAGLRDLQGWRSRRPELGRRCRSQVEGRFTLPAMVDGIEAELADARRGG